MRDPHVRFDERDLETEQLLLPPRQISTLPRLVDYVEFCSTWWMSEGREVRRRLQRSRREVQRLAAEFRTSRLRPSEFCRIHGLTHGTLQRGVSRDRIGSGSQGGFKGLVAVEVRGDEGLDRRRLQESRCGLEVILAKSRRIELSRGFDGVALRRAVELLEGF